MYIKEIELNNFRIYKGKNRISLLPEQNKNMIIISGKNGFGKTTFLMSLVWCLYGKQMEKVDELYKKEIQGKGNYAKYITDSLNRKAKEQGEIEFSVSITFSEVEIPDITCDEIKVTRIYNDIKEKCNILIDGQPSELIQELGKDNQIGEEVFIRDFILPIEIAKFFFFDAEKVVALADVNSSSHIKELSKAYSEVLGIQKYEDLKINLEEIQDGYRKKSANLEEKTELNTLEGKIKNNEINIESIESEISNLEEKHRTQKIEYEEAQTKLILSGDTMTIEELNSLKKEKEELEKNTNEIKDKLKELYNLIPFAFTGDILTNISEQLENEKLQNQRKYDKENINSKIKEIIREIENKKRKLQFIVDPDARNFYEEQIEILIKKHFLSDISEHIESVESLHDFSTTKTNEFNRLIGTLKHNFQDTFNNLTEKYHFIKSKLDSIKRKIREAEKNSESEYISKLRMKKELLSKELISIEKAIKDKFTEKGELTNKIKTNRQRQEILRKKIDDSAQYSGKAKKIKILIQKTQNFISQFKEEKKESLENKILTGLKTLLHKKDFIQRVEVDISIVGDDINISLYDQRNEVIDKNSLSMGERQMYASALLNALVEESNINFPVFIDSPMQKLDQQHTENIIKNFYPNVSKQVVIFPLINKELTEKEYKLIEPNVNKVYLIDNTSNDSSEFLPAPTKDFLKNYN